jgi:hypothetical protein
MTTKTEQEIEQAKTAGVALEGVNPEKKDVFLEICAALLLGKVPEVASSEQIAADIAMRILQATTAEELLAPKAPVKPEEHLYESFTLLDVTWQLSAYDEGPPVYAVLSGRWAANNEPLTMTCGGVNVIAAALKLWAHDLLPQVVQITQATRPTTAGFYPLWLERGTLPEQVPLDVPEAVDA